VNFWPTDRCFSAGDFPVYIESGQKWRDALVDGSLARLMLKSSTKVLFENQW
jgi:hypothetical protein